MSDPTVTPSPPTTVGDLSTAFLAAQTAQVSAVAAAAIADAAVVTTNQQLADINTEFGSDLSANGPTFSIDTTTGVVTVFESNRNGGVTAFQPRPATSPLSGTATPTTPPPTEPAILAPEAETPAPNPFDS
jgi:hypothetical protein